MNVDTSNKESKNVNGIFLSDGESSFDLSNIMIKKFHRKRKGKRYLVYFYKEYSLYEDFIINVFGAKIYKKNRKLGGVFNALDE